jgi:hypothetical protein
MPTRAALRVIQHRNNALRNHAADNFTTTDEAVMGAYQVLADAMGASLEVTLDGQVVLYTNHFKPSAQQVGYIEARDLTPEEEAQLSY